MGLTQVSTDGVKDDAVTAGKIPANAVGSSELADNAVDTNAIASLAVTANKIAAGEITNTHIGTGAINGDRLTDETVTLAKLPHGDGSSDGKFLRANNGADPSFETITLPTIQNPSTFTGNNSTTTITISSGHNVNSVLVVYNGLVLTPTTDYTISGTTMTMQFTPPTNAQIIVRYLPN